MHPSREIYCAKSEKLKGKKIVLCVTSSIAAVESVKLIRELIRNGAEVFPVLSENAQKIIHPYALEFASGKEPVTELTGKVEHVALCGDVMGKANLLVIAPCTANTLSKIAHGIDDTPVTTFATTALSSGIPIIIVPAMHSSMYRHKVVVDNIDRLKEMGAKVIEPKLEEGKAKMPGKDEIVAHVIRMVGKSDLSSRKILIISGSTKEAIDEVRFITNQASGKTGVELATQAWERGAEVKLLQGYSQVIPPSWLSVENFYTVNELFAQINDLEYSAVLLPAAISDYSAKSRKGKIPSGKSELVIRLKPTPRVIAKIRKNFNGYLVGFKLECDVNKEELIKRAKEYLDKYKLDLVVANDLRGLSLYRNRVFLIDHEKVVECAGKKELIAEKILDKVSGELE